MYGYVLHACLLNVHPWRAHILFGIQSAVHVLT